LESKKAADRPPFYSFAFFVLPPDHDLLERQINLLVTIFKPLLTFIVGVIVGHMFKA
jgi:hypothetical protein